MLYAYLLYYANTIDANLHLKIISPGLQLLSSHWHLTAMLCQYIALCHEMWCKLQHNGEILPQ